ncbi:hypothetical protein QO010_004493 [Caulobacter ginsengisoli]|uniref:Twin-arginine translocation pathway signal protein n=1 Tax=Caulobacter ginsengisoli TaxID=400775 RepID=A0ABU0J0F6_9CAUL|nr:hypothetical protein [Caulobacter ginsengisoli]MDQ0466697.1 hypothetical protein [Caulobacter ginsengisoli]
MLRRDFIRLVGGGAVFAATGCASAGPDPRAAWSNPGAGETDPRKRALAWAILAPNPHNMQPWLADLSEPDAITLYVDRSRLLPVTDPFNRQIVIGCGAFLELLSLAAGAQGLTATITPFPLGEPAPNLDDRPIARVVLSAGGQADPLFAQALKRRTNRARYEDRPVTPDAAAAIGAAANLPGVQFGSTVSGAARDRLRAQVFEGSVIEANTADAHQESLERTFLGAKAVAAHRYGISIEGPAIEAAVATGLLTRARMAQPGSWAFKQEIALMKAGSESAAGFVWLTTAGNSRAEQLTAGRAYLRANLAATGLGLSMQPWSQGLQEYPTMAGLFTRLHADLTPDGGRIQMLSRIGYAKPIPPAPRRGLAANLKPA